MIVLIVSPRGRLSLARLLAHPPPEALLTARLESQAGERVEEDHHFQTVVVVDYRV